MSRTGAMITNPRVGDVVRPLTSRSGRCWQIVSIIGDNCTLKPLGDDVVAARSETTGKWQGGVRWMNKSWRSIVSWELVSRND